jgi:hypothetical protein
VRSSWYRHLPTEIPAAWSLRWTDPLLEIASALVAHPDDERCAYWTVCEQSILASMARTERVRAELAAGRLF